MALTKSPVPIYRRIAQDAWRIAVRHQHLWIFGFFATFIGFGGVSEVLVGAYDRSTRLMPIIAGLHANPLLSLPGATTLRALVNASDFPLLSLVVFTAILALGFAVFAWIVTLSIGSLIASIAKINRGGDPTFPDAMREGAERFLPVFGVNVAMKALIAAAFFLTGTNLFALLIDSSAVAAIAYLIAFVLFTAIAIIASILQIFASNAVVVDGDGAIAALGRAWSVLRHHWLISLEMTVILFLVTLFATLAAGFAATILAVPFVFLVLLASAVGAQGAIVWLMTVGAVIALVAVVSFGSFMTTFQSAAWTLLWHDIRKKKHTAHLQHWWTKWLGVK
jgi:hypothetical protein